MAAIRRADEADVVRMPRAAGTSPTAALLVPVWSRAMRGMVAHEPAALVPNETIDDRVTALLAAGSNITLTYDDTAGTLTIASSGGGGNSYFPGGWA